MPVDYNNPRFRRPVLKEQITVAGVKHWACVSRAPADIPEGQHIRTTPAPYLVVDTDVVLASGSELEYDGINYTITDKFHGNYAVWRYSCRGPLATNTVPSSLPVNADA